MSINMVQGQSVILEKSEFDFSKVTIGLGWDIREAKKGVISFFAPKSVEYNYDLDAFSLLLDEKGKIRNLFEDVIYYKNLKSKDGTIEHLGDNLTGHGEGDDEQIQIQLSSVAQHYAQIIVGVSIYRGEDRNQDFFGVKNAYVRACDANDQEVCRYDLANNKYQGHTIMLLGNLYQRQGRWKFLAMGDPKLGDLQDLMGGYIPRELIRAGKSDFRLPLDK